MRCPDCGSWNTSETGEEDSLGNVEHECEDCGYMFDSTEEYIEDEDDTDAEDEEEEIGR